MLTEGMRAIAEDDLYALSMAEEVGVHDLLSAPGIWATLVNLNSPDGKRLHLCERHSVCMRFKYQDISVTKDPQLIADVMAQHPDQLGLGVTPDETVLILDIDSDMAWDDLRFDADLVPEEHYVVKTARGWHVYLQADGPLDMDVPEGLDVRHDGVGKRQYVLAPGTVRRDGQAYIPTHGRWGQFQHISDDVAEYLGVRQDGDEPEPDSKPARRPFRPTKNAGTAKDRVLGRADELAYLYEHDDDWRSSRDDLSSSGDLFAFWNVCYWNGLEPEVAVQLAFDSEHHLARKAWGSRDESWALADAERAYATARKDDEDDRTKPRQVYSAFRTIAIAHSYVTREDDRTPEALEYIVSRCNEHQKFQVGVGVAELAGALGVSKMSASRTLRRLQERGLLEMIEDYEWTSSGENNRVREYLVVGMESEELPDEVLETSTDEGNQSADPLDPYSLEDSLLLPALGAWRESNVSANPSPTPSSPSPSRSPGPRQRGRPPGSGRAGQPPAPAVQHA